MAYEKHITGDGHPEQPKRVTAIKEKLKKRKKNLFSLPKHKKLPLKVAHNPTRPPVFSPASFCFVKLRQF